MATGAGIATSEFGRTGHHSTRVIFGAAALGSMRQDRADRVMQTVIERGINHIDTAASYGESELRLGPWMESHRERFFLATKTGDREGALARDSVLRSLERLRTDHLDLVQFHNLVEEDEWHQVHGPGGALEALVELRDEGLIHHIGVTGHGLRIARMHLRSLEQFDYDSVLLPYNFVLLRDPAYRRDVEELLELCAERRVAVQTIKSAARRRWEPDTEGPRFSWYEPITEEAPLARAVRWLLSRPQLFLNTSSDARLLPRIIDAATSGPVHQVPSDEEMEADALSLGIRPLFDGAELERI